MELGLDIGRVDNNYKINMKLKEFNTLELSQDELKTIDGGIVFMTAVCIFAAGMAIGTGIGYWVKRR
ncbi:hypothetical protein G1K72_03870 [Tenacibaculum finnmarkense]|nr:hypothetical protein [Tenacibaculum finnmarkense]